MASLKLRDNHPQCLVVTKVCVCMLYSTDEGLSGSTSCLVNMRKANGVVSGTTVNEQRLVISGLCVNGSISNTNFPLLRYSFVNPGMFKRKKTSNILAVTWLSYQGKFY